MIIKGNSYFDAALRRLEEINQEEEKQLKYTARQKIIFDHNSYIEDYYNRGYAAGLAAGLAESEDEGRAEGRAKGIAEGRAKGIAKERAIIIAKLKDSGMTDAEINAILN